MAKLNGGEYGMAAQESRNDSQEISLHLEMYYHLINTIIRAIIKFVFMLPYQHTVILPPESTPKHR